MSRHSFLAALLGALLSTAAFAQSDPPATYIITPANAPGVEPMFSAYKNGNVTPMAGGNISKVLADIAADAVDPMGNRIAANVQFGDGGVLNIGLATAEFPVGISAVLSGNITSNSDATIKIPSGANVSSEEANITNTASGSGYAIHNSSGLSIISGTVTKITGGAAIYHNAANSLTLGGSPTISGGIIVASSGSLRVVTDSIPSIFDPGSKTYSITLQGEVSAGRVVVIGGKSYANNFTLTNNGSNLGINGNDLAIGGIPPSSSSVPSSSSGATATATHTISGNPTQGFTAIRNSNGTVVGTANQPIQTVIGAIKQDVINPTGIAGSAYIQFGTAPNVLDIGAATAEFTGPWNNITLSGKITSNGSSTIKIKGTVRINSIADIANTGSGYTVDVENGGSLTLGGSPAIGGSIRIAAGTTTSPALSVTTQGENAFAPVSKTYSVTLDGEISAGRVVVTNGAGFANSFTLANTGWYLEASGNDLVLTTNPTPIAHSPLPAIHSEATAYYNMKGEPMGSSKPATPGVYLVKQGSSIRKVVVR